MKKNSISLYTLIGVSALLASTPCAYAQQAAATPAATATAAKGPIIYRAMVLSQLPPEKLAMYKAAIAQLRTKNKVLYDQIAKLQGDLSTILTAEKFDKPAYMAKVAEIDKIYTQTHTNTTEAIVGVAEKFTPEERKVLDSLHRTPGGATHHGQSSNGKTGK